MQFLYLWSHDSTAGAYNPLQVGASEDGMLKEVNVQVYCDTGFTTSEQTAGLAVGFLQNVYNCPFWKIDTFAVKTDTASNTACRAPGSTEVSALE